MSNTISRRHFLKDVSLAGTGLVVAGGSSCTVPKKPALGDIIVDPEPIFDLSPRFYMQFMEPLGVTDASVAAAWDWAADDWRKDVIEATADLAPGCVRWGGGFVRYYKWREGIGDPKARAPMYNYYWGGVETNRVGTHELCEFCRRVGAEPLIGINFQWDGLKRFKNTFYGEDRTGDAAEAADWVSYANDPDNRERRRNGQLEPYNIKLWQLGNETSYETKAGFSLDEAVGKTVEFSRAMKERDPSISLVGWGDVENVPKFSPQTPKNEPGLQFWADRMVREAGEYLDMIAMHMMGIYPADDSMIRGFEYRKNPEAVWRILHDLGGTADFRLRAMESLLDELSSRAGIAVTEGHLSLQPYNANAVLTTWLSAAYHARTMNTYLRHGDRVMICTGADFCGTRWTVNALKIPVPRGRSFLLPIASIMRLYKKYGGSRGAAVKTAPADLDIAATREGDRVYLHVLNTNFNSPVRASLAVEGMKVTGGMVYEIAPEDPLAYVDQTCPEVFLPVQKKLDEDAWTFPPRSVSVVALDLEGESL